MTEKRNRSDFVRQFKNRLMSGIKKICIRNKKCNKEIQKDA